MTTIMHIHQVVLPGSNSCYLLTFVFKAMSGVIEHIKLLLIDSSVYAEEVEPTGVVPMEVSLER